AGLKLQAAGREEDLVAAAPILCARSADAWGRLCESRFPKVRDAAATAAGESGGAAHLPKLADLCADPDANVRLAAIIAFRRIRPEAEKIAYDHRAPSPEALAALKRLSNPE
ncbi:MAG: HEAT repeat domain-containing protein, partial [Planctomycetota bacterium]